jgi:hypothetical protein
MVNGFFIRWHAVLAAYGWPESNDRRRILELSPYLNHHHDYAK